MQRKGARRRNGGEWDTEALLDELYTTAPSGFVSRREELAEAARKAGRADDARRIHAARRPTLAAWASNVLLRSQPEECRRFLELGRSLREAYRTLDVSHIRELSAQPRGVVSALSRQAARLAREAGHPLSGGVQQEVESTLRAVLADQEAADQWATARLESALTPPSEFPAGPAPPAGLPSEPARPTAASPSAPTRATAPSPPARTREKDELAERRRQRQEQLAQAREAARAATRRLRDRRERQADAEASLRRARDRQDRARQQVSAAERQLLEAREELQRADQEQQQADERHAAAADALARAEREAREAAHEVERLGGSPVKGLC